MKIRIVNHSKHPLPAYETKSSAGMDLRASLEQVILINLSHEEFTIPDGERIAQMIISSHETAEWMEVEELVATDRGAGGFGHTGTM